jgi:hypothetical protein
MMPTLTDLYNRFTDINGSHPTPPAFRLVQKFPILRPAGFKIFEFGWGLVISAFNFKLHGEVMKNAWSDATAFESHEFWDCLNDGWMREYIYPHDNLYLSQPSAQRVLRLGPSSFRGWIDMPTNDDLENYTGEPINIQMNTSVGLSFAIELVPTIPSDYLSEIDDDYDCDDDYEENEEFDYA